MVNTAKKNVQSSPRFGVKPAHQGRSRKRRDELISAGMDLLCKKNFADISIIELTSACGYSVGTFYSRFEDKESFFLATQKAAVSEMIRIIENEFSEPFWKTAPADDVFRRIVDITIDGLLTNFRGIVRGSVAKSASNPSIWLPIRQCGETMSKIVVNLLSDRFLEEDPDKSEKSIIFGLQMFYGTLVQAVLNNPGPVKLEDPAMRTNLTNMLIHYTQLQKS